MRQKSGQEKQPAEDAIRDIRRATRPHFSGEEKIRIVLEGRRGEESIAVLRRREGIASSMYYGWSKEFLETGKKRLAGEAGRIAGLYQLGKVLPTQLSRLRSLTPGPLPFSAMNSTPAASRAERIAASVRGCGDRFPISKSESVTLETPAAAATAAAVIPRPARAIRHCSADMVISLTVEDFLACSILSM